MKELRNLALQLGKMGLLKVTLEADLNEFLELRKAVSYDFIKSSYKFTGAFEETPNRVLCSDIWHKDVDKMP